MEIPGQLVLDKKPKNQRTDNLVNGVEMEKKVQPNPYPAEKANVPAHRTPYEMAASVGNMPTDAIQKNTNRDPPIGNLDSDSLRKDWSNKKHIKNSKALDKHRAEKKTQEQQNLKQVIGTQEGNSPSPGPTTTDAYK